MTSKLNIELFYNRSNDTIDCNLKSENLGTEARIVTLDKLRDMVLPKVLRSDPSMHRSILRGNSVNWNIEIVDNKAVSKRLTKFNAYLFFPVKIEHRLYDFQKQGVEWLLQNNNRILADDMGLGKTVQVLVAIQRLIFEKNIDKILLLAPNSLTKNWLTEAKHWAPNLSIELINNDAVRQPDEANRILSRNNLVLANYPSADLLARYLDAHQETLDLLICDEAHKLRKSSSSLNKSVLTIKATRKWLLTGTPLERDEGDIQTILSIFEPTKYSYLGSTSSLMLRSNLARLSLRRVKEDVLKDLPKMEKHIHEVNLAQPQYKNYQDVKKLFANSTREQKISMITKLALATCETIDGENAKIQKAKDLILKAKNRSEKVIVFSNYNAILHQAKSAFLHSDIESIIFTGELGLSERHRALSVFKSNANLSVILINARVGAEGLTLTEANNVIFLNEWWNPSSNRQAEDRVNRIGQKSKINVHIIRAKNTIDTDIAAIIEGKQILEKKFMQELTSRLES